MRSFSLMGVWVLLPFATGDELQGVMLSCDDLESDLDRAIVEVEVGVAEMKS
jgi:hypothetical protein